MVSRATAYHKNTFPGGHEIYIFVRSFLGLYYYIYIQLVCSMLRNREDFFKKYMNFTLYTQKLGDSCE